MKQEIKQDWQQSILEQFIKGTIWSLIMWAITGQAHWLEFAHALFLNTRMLLDSLQPKQEVNQEEDKLSTEDFERAKQSLKEADNMYQYKTLSPSEMFASYVPISLNTLECTKAVPVQENTMYDDFDEDAPLTYEDRTRAYFDSELANALDNKRLETLRKFGLDNDNPPSTFNEFMERMDKRQFKVKDNLLTKMDDPDEFSIYNFYSWIEWRDPAIQKDKVGYKKTMDNVMSAYNRADRQIKVADLKELPKLVADFETTTFH